ncbi:MAG: hypothetical protein ABIL58_23270 [Pseudomonadota bacterium]
MIDKATAVAKFKEILGTKGAWGQIAESQFVEHLAIFASWALRQALWVVERAFQEFFRSTASARSSILAHVEDENYVPIRATPSTGTCTVTNNGAAAVAIASGQAFQSDGQVDYVSAAAIELDPAGIVTIQFQQLRKEVVTVEVTEARPFFEILFDAGLSGQISSIAVSVDGVGWALAAKFQNADSDSEVYDEFYAHTDQAGIRFGNGIFGAIPQQGSIIEVELWLTDGDTYLAAGQPLTVVGEVLDVSGDPVNLAVTTAVPITGGTPMEDGESIRRNLQYWPLYNGQLVWDDDYIYFLRRLFPNIVWIRVWGEKEAEAQAGAPDLAFINTIFVSAYEAGGADISVDVLAALNASVQKLNRRFEWVDPDLVEFTLTVTGKVGKGRVLTDVAAAIEAVLTANYGPDSASRRDAVYIHDIYALIEATGYFSGPLEYFTVTAAGDMTATLLEEMVAINLGSGAAATATNAGSAVSAVAVDAGGSGYSAATVALTGGGGSGATATATVAAGAVTEISVTSGGSGYTSAPDVEISGDGAGATATATIVGGAITAITVTAGGSNYFGAPAVTISGGGGTGATAGATIAAGAITEITVTAGGSGYTSAPDVAIEGSTISITHL